MRSLAPDSREVLSVAELDRSLLALICGEESGLCDSFSEISVSRFRALLERSRVHEAAILVINALSGHTLEDRILTEMMQARMAIVAHDIRMTFQTAKVLRAFADAGIRAHIMKGPVLWRALQLDGPSKASGDIDLLIAPTDVERADGVLGQLGYKCVGVDPNEATYASSGQAPVDLHWSLIRWVDQSPDFWQQIWDNQTMVLMEGTEVPTLSPTHTILALLLHSGCHHLCTDWASLHDIAQCTRVWQDSIDWQEMLVLADKAGRRCALYPPLALASEHFAARVPGEFLRATKPQLHRRGMVTIARLGFGGRLTSSGTYNSAKRLWNLLSQADMRQAILLIARWARHHKKQVKTPTTSSSALGDRT